MAKYYLDADGVRVLVRSLNANLENKVDKSDLENYATTQYVAQQIANAPNMGRYDDSAILTRLNNLEGAVAGVYHFKGSVQNAEALALIVSPTEGDVYNLEDSGMNMAWTGMNWDELGANIDLSNYLQTEDVLAISLEELKALLYGGKKAVVSDLEGVTAMLNNAQEDVEIILSEDLALTEALVIPVGKTVTLDLNGETVSSNLASALAVDGGTLVLKNGNLVNTYGQGVTVTNGGSLTINGTNITSGRGNGVSAQGENSIITMEKGTITSQEAGILSLKDSTVIINGGTITGIDNGPIMGNGTVGDKPNNGENVNIIMNGGKLIAHIQSAGYVACGVYLPNSGSFTMNGGEIESDGAGIVMRGGTVNLNGGKITATGATGVKGKVGDSQVTVGPYAVVYEAKSRYPHYETLELNIANGMELIGTDGDINVLLDTGIEANITDNR